MDDIERDLAVLKALKTWDHSDDCVWDADKPRLDLISKECGFQVSLRDIAHAAPGFKRIYPPSMLVDAEQPSSATLQDEVREADQRTADARAAILVTKNKLHAARNRLQVAIEKFRHEDPTTLTPDQLIRQHLASEQQLRAAKARGEIEPPPLPHFASEIDRQAYFSKSGSADVGYGRKYIGRAKSRIYAGR